MKHLFKQWPQALLLLVLSYCLMACESEESDSPAPEATNAPTSSAVLTNSSSSIAGTQSGSGDANNSGSEGNNSTGHIWRIHEQNTNAGGSAQFPLMNEPVINAANFRNTDGTYTFGTQLFSNCDEFATHVTLLSAQDPYIVTNCGTEAFP